MAPIGKYRPDRRIDRAPVNPFGSHVGAGDGSGFVAPSSPPTVPVPTGLVVTASLTYSAATPAARVDVAWHGYEAYDLEIYAIQISPDPTFATGTETYTTAPNQTSAAIDGRRCGTTYYVRVATIVGTTQSDWSAAASVTTPPDTVAPGAVTAVAWQWLGNGDLVVTWTPPASANYKDAELRIYTSSTKSLQLRVLTGRTGATYTAAMNVADTGGEPVASVYLEVVSRSYGNVYGPAALPPLQPSKAPPATPTGLTSSWAGDAGLAGAECVLRWSRQDDAIRYRLTIDGVAQELDATTVSYPLAANTDAHGGIPDPSLTLSLLAIDGLGQASPAATGSAVNARPPATAVTIVGGFAIVVATITPSLAVDRKDYRLRIVQNGATVAMLRSADHAVTCDISPYGSGSYQIGLSVVDVFEQVSNETLSSAVTLDPLTIADLRVDATYDDDVTTAQSALNTLKDALLASGGVYYP